MFKQEVAGFFVACLALVAGQQTERISLRKCREYAALVSNSSTCGVNLSRPFYGEIRAAEKEFPHAAILGYGNGTVKEWQCGGSLISEQFVLASAHCFSFKFGDVKYVRLGDLNYEKSDDDSHAQEFEVVEIIRHPEYHRSLAYNDIALLKLNKNVSFNEYVRPACLHATKNIKYTSAIVSAWGKTSSIDISEDLIKVAYDIIPNDVCNNIYASFNIHTLPNGILEEKIVCATGKNNKDLCQGSSGSPLQVLSDVNCMLDIIGVSFLGLSGCGTGHPNLYNRVSHYLPWIENIVWPQQL